MKRFLIFVVALLTIGYTSNAQHAIINELDNGDIWISCPNGTLQMSSEEFKVFSYFVERVVDAQSYFNDVIKLKKDIFLRRHNPNRYESDLSMEYDSYHGFLVGDSDYVYIEPSALLDAIKKYSCKSN